MKYPLHTHIIIRWIDYNLKLYKLLRGLLSNCSLPLEIGCIIIPYLRVYHVENYVIHHHVVLHGGSRSKNAALKISLLLLQRSRRRAYERKTPARREITVRRRNPPPDASKWSPSSGCFPSWVMVIGVFYGRGCYALYTSVTVGSLDLVLRPIRRRYMSRN